MSSFTLLLLALAPGLGLCLWFYVRDRYDREPFRLLAVLFVFGALSSLPVIVVERGLGVVGEIVFGTVPLLGVAYKAFIVAGVTEEYFKRLVARRFAMNHPAFNEKLDGVVYCVFVSLGFACAENVLYVFSLRHLPAVWVLRGVLSVPAHMLFGVAMGYYLSLARFTRDETERRGFMKKSLLVPVLLHGGFDFLLFIGFAPLSLGFLVYLLYLWRSGMKKLNRYCAESRECHIMPPLPIVDAASVPANEEGRDA